MEIEQSRTSLKEEYQRAVNDPTKRQAFLDRVYTGESMHGVSKLRYGVFEDYDPNLNEKNDSFMCIWFRGSIFKRTNFPITVYPLAFYLNYNGFMSSLVDHEGTHAKDLSMGIISRWEVGKAIGENLVSNIFRKQVKQVYGNKQDVAYTSFLAGRVLDMECKAFSEQLRNADKRGISKQFIESLKADLSKIETARYASA